MKGDTVTVGDVFDSLKGSSQTQQSVLSATLQKALEKEYGSKVSKEDVDKAYKQASEQYGDQFSQVLAAYGQIFLCGLVNSVLNQFLCTDLSTV